MKDILLDPNDGGLMLVNGDFAVGESTQQEIELILTTFRGEWKRSPLLGAEIQRMIKAQQGITTMRGVVREQLEMDGFKKVTFDIENNQINVKAQRNGTQ